MLCILVFNITPGSLLNSQKLWFVSRTRRLLGHPWKLPQVISAVGVHRPGYLPQEGHRLTQFPRSGTYARYHAFLLSLPSAHPISFRCPPRQSVLRTSITRQKPGLNRIKMQLPRCWAFRAYGIKTDSK